ncbi:MAG TPA: toprim domain-containing protein [Candidatus Nitrosotenuis sp.]|nr:toprim domain-containing protein [Candidatus Nitrosotenuis sp.]
MEISYEEISDLREFIFAINRAQDSVIIVEGKRDAAALKSLGITEEILEFHSFGGITKFADSVSDYKNLIVLFDFDKKGKYLTKRVIAQLERRTRIDMSYKKQLIGITRGKIRTIEELNRYAHHVHSTMV